MSWKICTGNFRWTRKATGKNAQMHWKKNTGIFTSICRGTASHNVYLTENSPKLKTVYPSPRWHLQVSISWFNPSPSPPPAYSLLTQMALTSIYMMVQLLRGTHHHPLHTPSHPDGTHRYLYYGSTPMWNPSPPPTYSLSPRGHLQVSIQGWALGCSDFLTFKMTLKH